MKVLQILVLVIGFSVCVNAQNIVLSGTVYDINKAIIPGTEIIIKDTNNKTYKATSDDRGEYEISLPFGDYKIEFGSAGFKILRVINLKINSETKKTFDVTLEVGRCQDCNGAIYGKRWDDSAVLTGIVYDSTGAVIEKAQISFKDSEKKEIITRTNKDGSYKVEIENGIYSIEVNATGFKAFKIEKYKATGTRDGMRFDVVLEVKSCDDPTVICNNITADSNKIIKRKNNK